MRPGMHGRVHITQVQDSVCTSDPLARFASGDSLEVLPLPALLSPLLRSAVATAKAVYVPHQLGLSLSKKLLAFCFQRLQLFCLYVP